MSLHALSMLNTAPEDIWDIYDRFEETLEMFRKHRSHTEDETIEAHEFIMSCVGDADLVEKIKLLTGKDIRAQLTVEEMTEIRDEVRLLYMGNLRN